MSVEESSEAARVKHRRQLTARDSLARLWGAAAMAGAVLLSAGPGYAGASTRIARPERPPRPREVVAINRNSVVVLDSRDGHVLRTLAGGREADHASSVLVTPDGHTVFFTRVVVNSRCEQDAVAEIVTVPAIGGAIRVVARGQQPVVSPDGSRVAFGAPDDPNGCGPPTHLAVGPVDASDPRAFRTVVVGADLANAVPVVWDPDGFSIVFQVIPNGGTRPQFFEIDPRAEHPTPSEIKLPRGSYLTRFLGRRGDRIVARGTPRGGTELDAVNAGTGEVKEKVLGLPGRSVVSLSADASGYHLVFSTVGALPRHPEEPRLWRLTLGNGPRVQLAAGGPADGNQWAASWLAGSR